MSEPIFHMDGATEGTTQWRADNMQLVNWGGFHGHHQVDLSAGATLISGASGTGKSTLLDAYLALMMPSDVPFNGASNDAVTGRARGMEQRNIVSYLRGKTDSTREEGTQELRDSVLRGGSGSTWGAVSMTFCSDTGRRFTAMRAYYLPRGASIFAEVTMKMATLDGAYRLDRLDEVARSRFDKRDMKVAIHGIDVHNSYAEFAQTLHTRLGIGAGGDGSKALALLARIQGGQRVRTVDALYKEMVLETPATYAAADLALLHFADLESAYETMAKEAEKAKVLAELTGYQDDLAAARRTGRFLDSIGSAKGADTPFALWRIETEQGILNEAANSNRADFERDTLAAKTAASRVSDLESRLAALQEERRNNGGDELAGLKDRIASLEGEVRAATTKRDGFKARTQSLPGDIDTAESFVVAQSAACTFLDSYESNVGRLNIKRMEVRDKQWPLENSRKELLKEQESLKGRDGLVPRNLHEARVEMARATGLTTEDLPFVAELLDVHPSEERWRTAAEVVLSSIAKVVLVDIHHLKDLSREINPLKLDPRIRFEGVSTGNQTEAACDPRMMSGKLIFKDSPFRDWVLKRVQTESLDALCVETVEELATGGGIGRVVPSGQARKGAQGAHGGTHAPRILGFSNMARLDSIVEELASLEREILVITGELKGIDTQLRGLTNDRDAHRFILDTEWSEIDVVGLTSRLFEAKNQHAAILATNDKLNAIDQLEREINGDLELHRNAKYSAMNSCKGLESAHGTLLTRGVALAHEIERLAATGRTITVTDEQYAYLEAALDAVSTAVSLNTFDEAVARVRIKLHENTAAAQEKEQSMLKMMKYLFEKYQAAWPDPNLGTGEESADAYREILDTITKTGLHDRKKEWVRRLSEWSGQDLVPLNGAYEQSIEDIQDRLIPINVILSKLPFGAGLERLEIRLRRLTREDVAAFRKELKRFSSGATVELDDAQMERRFQELRKFMGRFRKQDSNGSATNRDILLDVRRHVDVSAVRLDADGKELSTYSQLGGKSGGETQELIAFIVGAALRYQLGDESRTRPRFAPVFLDEGFVKSDGEFAGRAVSAWKGLGFQLIIGAPLDKVTALEPYMGQLVSITKNQSGHSYVKTLKSTTGSAA